jgi:hypothetical protein
MMTPQHSCNKEDDIKKIETTLYGDGCENLGTIVKVSELHQKLDQRPTYVGMIVMAVGAIGAGVTLLCFFFNFLLNNQSETIKAQTKTIVSEALVGHEKADTVKWTQREGEIVDKVWFRLVKSQK